jgi:uncharacterized membrane protein
MSLRRDLDLTGAMCFVLTGMGWAQLSNRPLLPGVLLAVPLVFILPGYALTQVFFVRRGKPFGAVDLIVFSLGLSLVIDIVIGLLLNLLPVGLQWQSWTLSLGLVTEVCTLFAIFVRQRRGQLVKEEPVARRRIQLKEGALLGAALVVAALAFWLSLIRPPQPQPVFTQFWMLPAAGGNGCAVMIGVHSFEARPERYRIEVMSNGKQIASWASITLAVQQEWDQRVPVSLADPAGDAVIDARLFRLDQPGVVYREVHVMLQGCGS